MRRGEGSKHHYQPSKTAWCIERPNDPEKHKKFRNRHERRALSVQVKRAMKKVRLAKPAEPVTGSANASEERIQPEDHLPEHRD